MIAQWRALPRRERVLLALAAIALAAAIFVRPVACLVSTEFALLVTCPLSQDDLLLGAAFDGSPGAQVERDVVEESLVDAWGNPWRYERELPSLRLGAIYRVYSVGPDGVDDAGRGDDVVMRPRPELVLLADVRPGGMWAFVILLWLSATARILFAPRSPHVVAEAIRAALVASLPTTLAVFLVIHHLRHVARLEGALDGRPLFVPFPVAVCATLALLLWLAALRLRLRVRPADAGIGVDLGWRGLLLGTVAVIGLVSLANRWIRTEQADFERRRLLATACLGVSSAVDELLTTGDLDLVRAFVRRAPPAADVTGKADAFYDGLARAGEDALPLLLRAFEDVGEPSFSSFMSVPWRQLRQLDPALDALFAAIAARPHDHRSLTLAHSQLVASRVGRSVVAAALLPLLDDEGPRSGSVRDSRVCDRAVEELWGLFYGPRPFAPPPWGETSVETSDAVTEARAWARAGASFGGPVAWLVVDVRGLALVSGEVAVEVWWGHDTMAGRRGSPDPHQLFALGPVALLDPRVLQVVDGATRRVVELPITARAGETTWVRVDMATGTSDTRVYPAPP